MSLEDGNILREVCYVIFGGEFDFCMVYIEVCLVFLFLVCCEDIIFLCFIVSVYVLFFKDLSYLRYDELKIECRRLRRVDVDGLKMGIGREGYKLI